MSRKIVMILVCILVLGLSGCGDTLTLNQYNTSEIWYIAYTDIDTVCESNELTADGSSILHSEEDYLLLSYVVDSNIEITKELKDGGWDHLILTNPQWIDRFGDPSKLKPVEYGSLANSMQEFLDVQMPILTADGNVLPDGVGLYQYDGETLLAFPVHVALGAAEPIEAKNPLIILVDKPAQSLKASSCMLPLTSSGNVLFAEWLPLSKDNNCHWKSYFSPASAARFHTHKISHCTAGHSAWYTARNRIRSVRS